MKRRPWILLSLLSFSACGSPVIRPSPTPSVAPAAVPAASPRPFELDAKLVPAETVAGGVVRVEVQARALPPGEKLIGEFEGTPILFYRVPEKGDGAYEGLLGIPHGRAPGKGTVRVRSFHAAPGATLAEREIEIGDAHFALEHLKVDGKHVNPPHSVMARIARENREVVKAYGSQREEKLWKGLFEFPINSQMTSPYGTKRLYNGEERNFHGGLDLKAALGTPIRAPQDGIVILAKNLYFTGNTIMLDHGYGVVTLYAHMSKFNVKEGQRMKAGEVLGLSGATGRVSGPHLHWCVYISKVKVNPLAFMNALKRN